MNSSGVSLHQLMQTPDGCETGKVAVEVGESVTSVPDTGSLSKQGGGSDKLTPETRHYI